jgi:two-component system chemotaxis response regulator CheY
MRILVVDDSKAMRMIIARGIRQSGYGDSLIQEAANGPAALELARESAPDLILSDWNMPEMSGLELLKALREEGYSAKFVFITAEGTDEYRKAAVENGAVAILSKPFTSESLKLVLDQVLG